MAFKRWVLIGSFNISDLILLFFFFLLAKDSPSMLNNVDINNEAFSIHELDDYFRILTGFSQSLMEL